MLYVAHFGSLHLSSGTMRLYGDGGETLPTTTVSATTATAAAANFDVVVAVALARARTYTDRQASKQAGTGRHTRSLRGGGGGGKKERGNANAPSSPSSLKATRTLLAGSLSRWEPSESSEQQQQQRLAANTCYVVRYLMSLCGMLYAEREATSRVRRIDKRLDA